MKSAKEEKNVQILDRQKIIENLATLVSFPTVKVRKEGFKETLDFIQLFTHRYFMIKLTKMRLRWENGPIEADS